MRDAAQTYTKSAEEDIAAVTKKGDDLDEKVEDMEDQLDDLADRYYRKFSVMETALSKLNSVSGMLASMLNM
jgi:flagellar capping protein FliD